MTPRHASAGPIPPSSAPRRDSAMHSLRPGRIGSAHRGRAYSFVLDARGEPIELGSGRFAKVFLGEEHWLESETDFRRPVAIKVLQKGVAPDDRWRFALEMQLLERVQGHPHIVGLFASGAGHDADFLPVSLRDTCGPEFVVLERLDMSLEERLKGSRNDGTKQDLLAHDMSTRLLRVLDYILPVASAIEYAHLVCNISHRDVKPANVLLRLPDSRLAGSTLQVRLADFNVAKLTDEAPASGITRVEASVPGSLFFQSPEQETNVIELLVNVHAGSPEVEYFEDLYSDVAKNDTFSLFNGADEVPILTTDRARGRLILARPWTQPSETNVRARVQKAVGRPADIYSLGAMLYYLISGAYGNPKTLYDAFHKFIDYDSDDDANTIDAYLRHEYGVIASLRGPKTQDGDVAPADQFFSYKQYLDGNGALIDPNVMLVIARCMIRNKPDSYCRAHDLETRGITSVVAALGDLYGLCGVPSRHVSNRTSAARPTSSTVFGRAWRALVGRSG
jgi:serine/threonine protein kinase